MIKHHARCPTHPGPSAPTWGEKYYYHLQWNMIWYLLKTTSFLKSLCQNGTPRQVPETLWSLRPYRKIKYEIVFTQIIVLNWWKYQFFSRLLCQNKTPCQVPRTDISINLELLFVWYQIHIFLPYRGGNSRVSQASCAVFYSDTKVCKRAVISISLKSILVRI